MALRIRRRRRAAEQVEEAARGALELATGVAAEAIAEVKRRPHRARRAGIGLLGLAVIATAAAAIYLWWTRRREDEEFARLMREPEPTWPPVEPAAPAPIHAVDERETTMATSEDASRVETAPTAMPSVFAESASHEAAAPVQAVAHPWTAPAAPTATYQQSENTPEPAPRTAWNSHRDVPLFVLPPRPSVPFRSAVTPAVDRTQLPGSASFIR